MAKGGKREGAGRKPGQKAKLAELYNAKLAELVDKVKVPLIETLIGKALTGDIPALKEIHDRLMGKAKDTVEVSGKDGLPFTLIIKRKDEQ